MGSRLIWIYGKIEFPYWRVDFEKNINCAQYIQIFYGGMRNFEFPY